MKTSKIAHSLCMVALVLLMGYANGYCDTSGDRTSFNVWYTYDFESQTSLEDKAAYQVLTDSAGSTYHIGGFDDDAFLMKFDAAGDIVYAKIYDVPADSRFTKLSEDETKLFRHHESGTNEEYFNYILNTTNGEVIEAHSFDCEDSLFNVFDDSSDISYGSCEDGDDVHVCRHDWNDLSEAHCVLSNSTSDEEAERATVVSSDRVVILGHDSNDDNVTIKMFDFSDNTTVWSKVMDDLEDYDNYFALKYTEDQVAVFTIDDDLPNDLNVGLINVTDGSLNKRIDIEQMHTRWMSQISTQVIGDIIYHVYLTGGTVYFYIMDLNDETVMEYTLSTDVASGYYFEYMSVLTKSTPSALVPGGDWVDSGTFAYLNIDIDDENLGFGVIDIDDPVTMSSVFTSSSSLFTDTFSGTLFDTYDYAVTPVWSTRTSTTFTITSTDETVVEDGVSYKYEFYEHPSTTFTESISETGSTIFQPSISCFSDESTHSMTRTISYTPRGTEVPSWFTYDDSTGDFIIYSGNTANSAEFSIDVTFDATTTAYDREYFTSLQVGSESSGGDDDGCLGVESDGGCGILWFGLVIDIIVIVLVIALVGALVFWCVQKKTTPTPNYTKQTAIADIPPINDEGIHERGVHVGKKNGPNEDQHILRTDQVHHEANL